jgi:hypothetical protein
MNQHAQSVLGDFAAGANDKDTLRPDDWARFRRFVINAHIRRQSMSTVEVSDHLTLLGFSQKQAWRLGRFYTRAEAILTAMDVHGCALN